MPISHNIVLASMLLDLLILSLLHPDLADSPLHCLLHPPSQIALGLSYSRQVTRRFYSHRQRDHQSHCLY